MELLIILLLILLNGVFSMSEIALVSSRKVRLKTAVKNGERGAQTALNLSDAPTQFLSTVQIGITLIGILTGIYSGENITNDLEAWLEQFATFKPVADGLAVTIVLLAITFCSLVLGELVPKRIGLSNPENISIFLAPFMRLLSIVTYPFVWVLTRTSDLILALLGLKNPSSRSVTEEEIKAIVQEGMQGGEVQPIEQDIVERVFLLGDRKIGSLMSTLDKLTLINVLDDFQQIKQTVNSDLHRTYPVYQGDRATIIGVVLLKDLFIHLQDVLLDVKSILKPAYFLNENTTAYHALERFKSSNVHYALVTNEYGLVLGMVTLDDILRALVGDVSEFYKDEFMLTQRDDQSWLVDGQYPLSEFLRHVDMEDVPGAEAVHTVGGLILQELQRIPQSGDKVVWKGLELEVVDMDHVKIDKVLIRRLG